jgi:hypothetical protein
VERYVTWLFENSQIDAAAYSDAITALSQSQLALARYGKGTAERPMREASWAESRLYARRQSSTTVRHAVRNVVAATLCLVDANDVRAAERYLNDLIAVLPRRREQPRVPVSRPATRTYTTPPPLPEKAVWHSSPRLHAAAVRRAPRPAHGPVPG